MNSNRRQLLGAGAATALLAFLVGRSTRLFAQAVDVENAVREFLGAETTAPDGPLSLELPQIAEYGNSVPISISVQSPMTVDDYVESVLVLAPRNPNVELATFHFSPLSGRAEVATRIRLARSQTVIALAKTSAGHFFRAEQHVEVIIGGCGA